MRKVIKKIAVLILAAMIVIPAASVDIYASSNVTVAGGDAVKGGEVFTVTVTFDGDSIGRVIGDITYDTSMISYISGGSSSGNVGYVELKKAGTGEPLVFDLQFQALQEGSTQINVSASEMYDLNEGYMDTPSTVKSIVISGDADEEEIVEETTLPDDTAEDEGLSVDEKDDTDTSQQEPVTESAGTEISNDVETDNDNSGFLAKAIMLGIGILVLILIIVMILRRKK